MEESRPESTSWNSGSFRAWVEAACARESLVVLANREPTLPDRPSEGAGDRRGSSSGLVTALEPLTDNCRLLWIARDRAIGPDHTAGRREETHGSHAPHRLRVRRVPLTQEEMQGHYDGFCNEGLWPLCHRTSVRPTFRAHDFRMYSLANTRWAAALQEEMTTRSPIVLVQDYHLALAPRMIKERLPRATIATFWHIPFPSPGVLSACPWERALLEGLLGSSIVGFQTADDCRNFLDAAVCVLGAHVDRDERVVSHRGHRTLVRAYPASIEWPNRWAVESAPVAACRATARRRFGISPETHLIVGVDRFDYTKGLPQKFFALERLLVTRPEFRGKVVLLQVAEPSRSRLPTYSDYRAHVCRTADRISQRFAMSNYQPIVMLEQYVQKKEVFELFRASDVCYVGSLHDGMNLVAKEFVSARDDEKGVLILSEFTGAARELNDALCINPYASEDCARTLAEALTMPVGEQASRMQSMRTVVGHANAFRWAANVLTDAVAVHTAVRGRPESGRSVAGTRAVASI